ncbi:MAG: DUF4382 domain-containing protein [Bdellovibrionota bacterium]
MQKTKLVWAAFTFFCLGHGAGCGGSMGGNPEKSGIVFSITDAPVDNAKNVFIKIASMAVKQENKDWLEIPLTESDEIDLLALQNGRSKAFAALQELPAGTYTETRLILSETAPGRLVDNDGEEHALKIPSGSESGLKIKSSFTVTTGVAQELTIDFDLRKSLKLTGNGNNANGKYMLKPVLRLAENQATGSIQGQGVDGVLVCAYPSTVTVFESECEDAVTTTKVAAGVFTLSYLAPGSYTVVSFQDATRLGTKAGVVVKAKEATLVGQLP